MSTFTDNDYAGMVIYSISKKYPDTDVETLYVLGETALGLIKWSRSRYPEIPRGFVCDVVTAMNGGFGVPDVITVPTYQITSMIPTTVTRENGKDGSFWESGDLWKLGAGIGLGGFLLILLTGRGR